VALRFATVRPSYYHDWEPGLNKGRQLGILENYLSDLRDIKLSGEGVSELSYYPAPRRLLEEVGGGLKPKVRCFMNLKDHGAGLPACSRPSGVCFACGGRPLMR
jgi:hypothetical protein